MGQAATQGKLDRFKAAEQDLVRVSDHWEECPLCQPWERKVLSVTGRTPGYPTVSEAIAAGLRHVGCRHTLDLYVPGLSEDMAPQGPTDPEEAKALYEQRQKQRYYERTIRKWKRREMAAVDPKEQAKASRKVLAWQDSFKGFLDQTGRRRHRDREQVIWAPDAQRTARSAGARRSSIKLQAEAREQAQYEKQRNTVVREWMDSSSKPASIVTKTAAAEAFGGAGMVWNPRGYKPKPEDVQKAKEILRKMHSQTQEYLRREGIESVRLYRGVRKTYRDVGSVESWTESEEMARKFAGEDGIILMEEVPADRLLYGHRVPGWRDSKKFGAQQEWMVLSESPG